MEDLDFNNFSLTPNQNQNIYKGIQNAGSRLGTGTTNTGTDKFRIWGEGGGMDLGIQGIGVLGNLYQGYNANKLAKQGLRQNANQFNLNFNNQVKSHNTALSSKYRDTLTTRGYSGAALDNAVAQYMQTNGL